MNLRRMTELEFRAFRERSIPDYAQDKIQAGSWGAEEALEKSRQAHSGLLPQGLSTPDQHLFKIELDRQAVGDLWLALEGRPDHRKGFIYDVFVESPYRRRGLAEAALRLLEGEAFRLGARSLSLHVFGFNGAARALYEKLGYEVTDVNMSKAILQGGVNDV